MKIQNYFEVTLFFLSIGFLLSCGNQDDSNELNTIEGIYTGVMVVTDRNDPVSNNSFTDEMVQLTITGCGSNTECVIFTFQHAWGYTRTFGDWEDEGSFLSLSVSAAEDDPEVDFFENGVGTFIKSSGEILLSFVVTDGSAPIGTVGSPSVFSFDGIKE